MDAQKERQAFECWFKTTATYKTLWDFISTHQTNIKSVFVKNNGKTYQNDCVQIAWEAWQAAKAKAIPDGFTVVPIEITHKQIEAYMKGKVFPASMGEHRKFVERLSKDYKAMIEAAQE